MRKGSYSEELVRKEIDEHLDCDASDAHVIADGQTAETFGLMAELESHGAGTSRLSHNAAK